MQNHAEFAQMFDQQLQEVLDKGLMEYDTKEEYTDYMFLVSQLSQAIFRQMKVLLERMKKVKKGE